MLTAYSDSAPDRATLDASVGRYLLEFGSNDCGICRAALPIIAAAVETVRLSHLRIQDGKGRKLGRSYAIKLWPTLILLNDGVEIGRIVRPTSVAEITTLLQK